jgi:FlaA1/EpsC-like NDP-sugar epimerase
VSPKAIAQRVGSMSRVVIVAVQTGIFAVSVVLSFLLRFDLSFPLAETAHLVSALVVCVIVKNIAFHMANLDRGGWGMVSLSDVPRLAAANLLGSFFSTLGILEIAPRGFPRSIYVLDLLVCLLLTVIVRLAARILIESPNHASAGTKRTLIYGAGAAGISLLAESRRNAELPYKIVGLIDDDAKKTGILVHGVNVLGTGQNLPAIVNKYKVETVLIAVPSASGQQMTAILRLCQDVGVSFKTVPGLGEIIKGDGLVNQVRDVAVEDLLGRSQAQLDEEQIAKKLHGKVILVTGAGGSIGSELCRQIARFQPKAIVGYEISENALFHLDLQMKENFPEVKFYPEIGSVQKSRRLAEVLTYYRPSILYHAAAYKHVPMMETHVFEAVENNVFGSYFTAMAAARHGLEDFVMISTDKAVRPTSIMGVTKRLAELAVHSLQNGGTRFVSVRFGNVLGSNGSVIPLFKKQIAAGGPVKVTHPEMLRYFMTIPEASQLVLQASTMGKGGEIFVLDMGDPVRILDLARNLILLSGLRPGEDIRIEFSGIRPGEKLYEELQSFDESTLPTSHKKVKIFTGPLISPDEMKAAVDNLQRICAARDVTQLLLRLKEIVPDYNPSTNVLKRALADSTGFARKNKWTLAEAQGHRSWSKA